MVLDKVKEFISKKDDSTHVDTAFAPAVTQEHQREHRHEDVTRVEDYEHRQDHHQLRVQPVQDEKNIRTENTSILNTKAHEHDHGKGMDVEGKLAAERSGFKDTVTHHDGERTTSMNEVQEGHHTRHHVKEIVQPVVERNINTHEYTHVIDPHTHTVHEKPVFHEATVNKPMSLNQFEESDLNFKHRDHTGGPMSESSQRATGNLTGDGAKGERTAGDLTGSHNSGTRGNNTGNLTGDGAAGERTAGDLTGSRNSGTRGNNTMSDRV